MKYIKHLIFTFVILVGLSGVASAQKQDQKRPPKGDRPPVVTPAEKNPPKETRPKNNGEGRPNRGRGNRPGMAAVINGNQITDEVL